MTIPDEWRDLLEWMTEESEELAAVYAWKDGTTARNDKDQSDRRAKIAEARALLSTRQPEKTVPIEAIIVTMDGKGGGR